MKDIPTRTLDDLVECGAVQLGRGKIISKKDILACPGEFPIYSSAKDNDGKFGEYGRFMFDEELITWSVDGGGRLFHRPKHKFSVTNVGGTLRIVDRNLLDYKYLYYVLSLRQSEIGFDWVRKAHPSVIRRLYRDIPCPSLDEQRHIVSILDEAFDGIATAKANAEKNLQNARTLFVSHLQSVFAQSANVVAKNGNQESNAKLSSRLIRQETSRNSDSDAEMIRLNDGQVTKTGGRDATLRHIPGKLSLAVGMPSAGARKGWRWSALTDLARLESGHTPSRRHPEYWGGSVPWIGIQDARENHGRRIADTFQKTNELGIANSSARVLPEGTVCLSRTASVGYVVVMGRPMATSQDFVNWVCSDKLEPDFLKYLILAEGRDGLLRYASGSVHQTIYFPEAKAFHICHPESKEQRRIVEQCDDIRAETKHLESIYQRKLAALDELKQSLLHQAFSGAL